MGKTEAVGKRLPLGLDAATYLFHLFAVVARHRDARLDRALKPLGLNVSRHRALSAIALLEPCPMSELAALNAVDRTTMTRTVDQLVAAGLVERATPPADRRQVLLSVTPEGRRTLGRALRIIGACNADLLEATSPALVGHGIRLHRRLLANLVSDPETAERPS